MNAMDLKRMPADTALKITRSLGLFVFLGALGIFLFYPPHWALMDDASHLQRASQHFDGANLFEFTLSFVRADFGWGMFRPFYAIFIYLFYGIFNQSYQWGYLFIYLLTAGIFWVWAGLFARCLSFYFRDWDKNRIAVFRWFFFIFCYLFVPNYTLFFYASLQERWVLLFGAVAFFGMTRLHEREQPDFLAITLVVCGILLAVLSKASGLFLIPPLFLWLLVLSFFKSGNRQLTMGLCWTLFLIACAFGFYFLSIRVGYTSGYQLGDYGQRFLSAGGRFFSAFRMGFFALAVLFVHALRSKSDRTNIISLLAWPIALLVYLMLMVPWQGIVNYYLITPGGVFWTGCKLIVCAFVITLFPKHRQNFVIYAVLVVSLIVTIPAARKFLSMSRQHHVTGDVIKFLTNTLRQSLEQPTNLYMPEPCLEASDALSVFIGEPKRIQMVSAGHSFLNEPARLSRELLVTNNQCSQVPLTFSPAKIVFRQDPWVIYELLSEGGGV